MQFARLAIFVLAAVAGQVASVLISRPDDPMKGLPTNQGMVDAYCNPQGDFLVGDYACFRLNGDIRKRMQSAVDSIQGFVNNAGDMFVVVYKPDNPDIKIMEFHTDKTAVYILKPDGSSCLVVKTLNDADWNHNQNGGPDGSVDHNACATDPAIWLAD